VIRIVRLEDTIPDFDTARTSCADRSIRAASVVPTTTIVAATMMDIAVGIRGTTTNGRT